MFGRETETERETERERLFTRPNEITTDPVSYSFFCLLFFFSYRIMLYYIIQYKTEVQVYYILGVMERREECLYMCMCVCKCHEHEFGGWDLVDGEW